MKEINLLQHKVQHSSFEEFIKSLVRRAIPILILYALFFIGVMATQWYLSGSISRLREEQDELRQRFSLVSSSESLLTSLKHRIAQIDSIVANAYPFAATLRRITSDFAPPGITFRSIKVSSEGAVLLEIEADNSSALDGFVNVLKNKKLTEIKVSSVTFDKDLQRYSMQLTFGIPKS